MPVSISVVFMLWTCSHMLGLIAVSVSFVQIDLIYFLVCVCVCSSVFLFFFSVFYSIIFCVPLLCVFLCRSVCVLRIQYYNK